MNLYTMRARNNLKKSQSIRNPNKYVQAVLSEAYPLAIDEDRAVSYKGSWREKVFLQKMDKPLDLEIGIGIGYYFEHHAKSHLDRLLLGLEIKFKPLIQSLKRTERAGLDNVRGIRYNAFFLEEIFAEDELNDVIIHHPDPWSKRRKQKKPFNATLFFRKVISIAKNKESFVF